MSSEEKLSVTIIACRVLQDMFERLMPDDFASQVKFMDYGMHRVPKKMVQVL